MHCGKLISFSLPVVGARKELWDAKQVRFGGCCHSYQLAGATEKSNSKMAMSDVDVSSSVDQDEDPLGELSDEELFNLVQETL